MPTRPPRFPVYDARRDGNVYQWIHRTVPRVREERQAEVRRALHGLSKQRHSLLSPLLRRPMEDEC